ncbi:hypothetical protein ACN20G_29980 (plasmid) [Streptomyces sp. BI20]|uniref:hypothetical protein n=1 Tax=Streptomyces sp. BI20 TaxID=3403460 RepID=UPI003C7256CC
MNATYQAIEISARLTEAGKAEYPWDESGVHVVRTRDAEYALDVYDWMHHERSDLFFLTEMHDVHFTYPTGADPYDTPLSACRREEFLIRASSE